MHYFKGIKFVMQYTNRQKFSDTRLPYRFHVIESGMELFKQKLNQPIPG